MKCELAEEAADYVEAGNGLEAGDAGLVPPPIVPQFSGEVPELRDAMSLVWRSLLVWLAVLALFVIAGWVS